MVWYGPVNDCTHVGIGTTSMVCVLGGLWTPNGCTATTVNRLGFWSSVAGSAPNWKGMAALELAPAAVKFSSVSPPPSAAATGSVTMNSYRPAVLLPGSAVSTSAPARLMSVLGKVAGAAAMSGAAPAM